jgi:hypothetical protein
VVLMRRAVHALAGLAVLLGACVVEVNFDDTAFTCTDGMCPAAFTCEEGRCVRLPPTGDGGPADAAPPADAALRACDDQFGDAPSYQLCAEEATTCEFYNVSSVSTPCAEICPLYGATCAGAFDSSEGAECIREPDGDGCEVPHLSQICICTREPLGA